MLRSKLIKFPMSILKQQVNCSSNFASLFIFMTHNNSSGNFKVMHFLLWVKGSYQSPNFETFKCSGENLPYSSCHFPNHKSVFLEIFKLLCTFLGQTLNTLHNRNQWKCKFSDFWVLGSKFMKLLSFLKQQFSFYSNFPSIFRVMRQLLCIFFS